MAFAVDAELACDAVLGWDGMVVGRLAELASAGLGFARFLGPMLKKAICGVDS